MIRRKFSSHIWEIIKAICIGYSNYEDNPSSLRPRVECEHKICFDNLVRGIK